MAYSKRTSRPHRFGDYHVRFLPGGGFNCWKPGMKESGFTVPNDQDIKERYRKDIEETGKNSNTIQTYLGYRGILLNSKRSQIDGRTALGLPIMIPYSKKEIAREIRKYWKQKIIRDYLAGEDVSLPSVNTFNKEKPWAYRAARRKYGTFKKALDEVYPNLYHKVSAIRPKPTSEDAEKLRKELLSRFSSGKAIYISHLRNSSNREDRDLVGRVEALGESDLFKRRKGYVETVMKLTGLKKHDVEMATGARNLFSGLTEDLTALLLNWLPIFDLDPWGFGNQEVITRGEKCRFFFDSQRGYADGRVGNKSVEVKTGMSHMDISRIEDMINKYATGNFWETGEKMELGATFFLRPKRTYNPFVSAIEDSGITVVGYAEFQKHLTGSVKKIKKEFVSEIEKIRPRIHNLDYIIKLSKEMAEHPWIIVRKTNLDRYEWSRKVINGLIKLAGKVRKENDIR